MTPSFSVPPSCLISTAKIKVALRYKGSATAIARPRDVAFPARWKISGRIRITVEMQHCKRKRPPWWRRGRMTEAEVKQGERTGIHTIALTTASWDKSFLIMNTNHFYLPFVAVSSGFRGRILMIVCFFALDSNQAVSNSHVSVCCRFKNRHLIGRTWSWGWWEYQVFCTNQNFDLVMELDDKSGRRVFILWGL